MKRRFLCDWLNERSVLLHCSICLSQILTRCITQFLASVYALSVLAVANESETRTRELRAVKCWDEVGSRFMMCAMGPNDAARHQKRRIVSL